MCLYKKGNFVTGGYAFGILGADSLVSDHEPLLGIAPHFDLVLISIYSAFESEEQLSCL